MPKLLRFVAWAQMVTGALVAAYGIFVLSSGQDARFVGSLFILLGILSCIIGAVLFKAGKLGWRGSVVLQLLQLPAFSFGTVLYRLGLGAFLTLGVEVPEVSGTSGRLSLLANFGLGADFAFSFGNAVEEHYLGINVVALVLLLALLRNRPAG